MRRFRLPSAERVARDIDERLSLMVLPVVLMWRRWRVLDLPPRRWFSGHHPAVATIVVPMAYVSVRYVGRLSSAANFLPLGLEAWTTVLLVALIGKARVRLALLWRTS